MARARAFEGRASVRAWLYRIATNRSLDALRATRRRPEDRRMPADARADPLDEPLWLEPYPDALLEGIPDEAPGPEARYETKEAIALAFIVGLQHLSPQQRAVLVLRDVLGYRAAEVAEMLDDHRPRSTACCAARARRSSRGCRPPDANGRRSRTQARARHRRPLRRTRRERRHRRRGRPADRRRLAHDAAAPARLSGSRRDRRVPARRRGAPRRAAAFGDARQHPAGVRLLPPGAASRCSC